MGVIRLEIKKLSKPDSNPTRVGRGGKTGRPITSRFDFDKQFEMVISLTKVSTPFTRNPLTTFQAKIYAIKL